MREITPGIWHWTSPHPNHGQEVSSYFLPELECSSTRLCPMS